MIFIIFCRIRANYPEMFGLNTKEWTMQETKHKNAVQSRKRLENKTGTEN
jgi:hypothetical protein